VEGNIGAYHVLWHVLGVPRDERWTHEQPFISWRKRQSTT